MKIEKESEKMENLGKLFVEKMKWGKISVTTHKRVLRKKANLGHWKYEDDERNKLLFLKSSFSRFDKRILLDLASKYHFSI